MTDETGPWKKQWQPHVEGFESLGGAEWEFIDIERDILNAPRTAETDLANLEQALDAVALDQGPEECIALLYKNAALGVLANMQAIGIPEADTLLSRFNKVTPTHPKSAISTIELVRTEYFRGIEKAASEEEAEELKELYELSEIVVGFTNARINMLTGGESDVLAGMLDKTEQNIFSASLTDSSRAGLQDMIDEMRRSS